MRVIDRLLRRLSDRASELEGRANHTHNPVDVVRLRARALGVREAAEVISEEAGQGIMHETTSYKLPEPSAEDRSLAEALNREMP